MRLKLLGVVSLLVPRVPVAAREWAYARFGITMIAAVISHLASGDSIGMVLGPVIGFTLSSLPARSGGRALGRQRTQARDIEPVPRPVIGPALSLFEQSATWTWTD